MTRFEGFPQGGLEFFRQLAMCQDREWFKTHKADFEALWQAPMTALFDELRTTLRPLFPDVEKATPKVFRIYRDVRFSKDKTPFKTSMTAMLPLFGGAARVEEACAFYCDFGDKPFAAVGRWMMDGGTLTRFRKAVANEKSGAAFARAVEKARKAGFTLAAHTTLKRPPPGFDATHPRLELLKLKGFALSFPTLQPEALGSRALVTRLKTDLKKVTPLVHWLEAAVRSRPLPVVR